MIFQKVLYCLLVCLSSLSLIGQKNIVETICQDDERLGIKTSVIKQYQKVLGYAVWMNSEKVKSDYFIDKGSYRNVHARLENWKNPTAILVSTSGNYVNKNYYQSIGLTVDKGKAMNKTLAKKMDGLVVTLNGSLSILNIQEPFELPGVYGKINPTRDKMKLLNWAQRSKASIFQTHLLAYENNLTISTAGNIRPAKRKFLATVYDKMGTKQRVLFYLQRGDFLHKAAKKVFGYLQSQGYYVYAMVNLDTGGNDILTLNTTLKNCDNREIKGFMPINYATNLLVFYTP